MLGTIAIVLDIDVQNGLLENGTNKIADKIAASLDCSINESVFLLVYKTT